jgi:nucleoside-diphosphate-sugar epimerase
VAGLKRSNEQGLRNGVRAGRPVASHPRERTNDDACEAASIRGQRARTEPAQAPLAVGELVRGKRAAHRLVVPNEPLLLRIERAERELRQRIRPRLRPRPLRVAAAAGQQPGSQERADAPVDSAAMRVLVTGASGFVGRALVEELRHGARAYEVHALERRDGELADEGVAQQAISETKADVVIHSAARIGIARCDEEPLLALRSNVLATAHVARAAARLVYISTADVYGAVDEADEEMSPAPASLYALTKLWGEQVARQYAPNGLVVIRLANPYGPGSSGALPTMLRQAAEGQPVPAFRDEKRSWLWIGDATRAIRLILESGESGIFNVASDQPPLSLAAVARLACELAGAPPKLVEEVDPPTGRVAPRIAIDRLRALGWRPEVGLEEGLRLTLESWHTAAVH